MGIDEPETVGVLRCVGRKKSPSDFAVDTFDQIDLETLQFFCEQITPVLRSIISRVEREKSISIVKHDLVGPISHLRHIADHLETTQTVTLIDSEEILNSHSEHKNPIKVTRRSYQMKIPFRDLMNMKSFAIAASNLVFQLDPEMSSLAVFEPKPTSLERDIIARLKEVMKYDARSKRRMTIAFEGFEKIPPLMLDRGATERVFFNLISNAIKYGDKDSQIMINAFEAVDSFRVTVQNQGPGISERERELVFDEEYRSVDAAKSPIPGLGLGLYIARKAMERLGGRLELTSLKNPTTFCLYFPLSLRCM
jgi:signal transduction histidine kinase